MSKPVETGSNGGGRYAPLRSNNAATRGPLALADVEPELVRDVIGEVLMKGDAMMFGQTKDGGAVCIVMYSSDAVDKLYCATAGELQDALQGIRDIAAAK